MKDKKRAGLKCHPIKILLVFLFLFSFTSIVSSEDFGYNYLEGDLNIAQAVNYSQQNVNNSEYFDGYTPTTLRAWFETYFNGIYCKLTGCTMAGDINMGENGIFNIDSLSANNIMIWDDTLNADGILSMYTHDLSNSFVLDVNDAGSTDFYSTDMYQFRSGDNDFQFMHDAYTGTYLDIMVSGVNPEIESESNEISFVDNNLTTTGNITASNFFGTFSGNSSIWSKSGTTISPTTSGDTIKTSGQLNLTNGSYSNRIYTDSNGTLVFYFD
jgi:hypothetical protein